MNFNKNLLRRLAAGALAAALVLMLAVMAVRWRRIRQEDDTQSVPAPEVSALGEYTAMTYSAGGLTLSFQRLESGRWQWTDEPDFPLDDTTVRSIAELCGALKPQQTLTDAGDIEGYGLDDPAAELTVTDDRGKTLTLSFGNATTDGESRYMMENGQTDTLYILDDALYQALCVPVYDMYAMPQLPVLSSSVLESVTLAGNGSDGGSITVLTAQRTEGTDSVTWRSNGANVTDDARVQGLLADLRNLQLERCVDYRPSEEAAEICGFGAPCAMVTAVYRGDGDTDATFTITVGNTAPQSESRYVRLNGDSTIFLLAPESLDPMMNIAAEGLE